MADAAGIFEVTVWNSVFGFSCHWIFPGTPIFVIVNKSRHLEPQWDAITADGKPARPEEEITKNRMVICVLEHNVYSRARKKKEEAERCAQSVSRSQ